MHTRFVGILSFAVALLMLSPLVSPCSDAEGMGLLLYEVNKVDANEGVSIHNYSSEDIDLYGYRISDTCLEKSKEGSIEFTETLIIHSGETYTFAKNVSPDVEFTNRNKTFSDGDSGVKYTSGFNLASNGDDIYLYNGSAIIDAFCFGNVTINDGSLWTGNPFSFKSGFYAVRCDCDTNTADDWINSKSGYTNLKFNPELEYDVEVTPFLFPDSGGIPIYEALEQAKDTVLITMYELTNRNLYALLCELEQRTGDSHVDVVLLLERSPIGHNTISDDSGKMRALVDAGGEVYLIGGSGSRFSYVHAKYCVIDNEKVIMTSENWTNGNLCGTVTYEVYDSTGNRGWGAIIEGKEYASFMTKVFYNDCNPLLSDVVSFEDATKTAKADILTYSSPTEQYDTHTYPAKATPILSPDNSMEATMYYIDNSKTRAYSEQQSITTAYLNYNNPSPLASMKKAADRGVDTRFILNCSNDEEASCGYVDTINVTSYVKAAPMTGLYLHNKGSICDDTALLSSVNWTATSFQKNRETCVAIHSSAVADYFAEAFLSDFDAFYSYGGLTVTFKEIKEHYDKESDVTLSVDVVQRGNFKYEWIVDGETVKTTGIPRTVLHLYSGTHTITVNVRSDSSSLGTVSAAVEVDSDSMDISDKMTYALPIGVVLVGIAIAIKRLAKGRCQ